MARGLNCAADDHMPAGYHALMVPRWLRQNIAQLTTQTRRQVERVGQMCRPAAQR